MKITVDDEEVEIRHCGIIRILKQKLESQGHESSKVPEHRGKTT